MPRIPHGEVLVFGLANIQIIMSWLGAPEFMDRGYHAWIDRASQLPKPVMQIYLSHVVKKQPDPWAIVALLGGEVPQPIREGTREFADLPPNKYVPEGVSGKNIAKLYKWMEEGHVDRFPSEAITHLNTVNQFYVVYQNFYKTWKFIM
ncbi:hypothetical protein MNAN1_001027 [Malassezia nana]|uniref:Uncharacterized protein n=1 Tax=Malassezia nana TaxID=180528 RepID=A0AAF0EGK4_9BASI|nr:hypothetical protein MNAN1_001027 [Malassezia nana]